MDPDTLVRLGEVIISAVLSQDTTDYCARLHPTAELVSHLTVGPDGTPQGPPLRVRGVEAFGRATLEVFRWMQRAPAIAQPKQAHEVRRAPRKGPETAARGVSGAALGGSSAGGGSGDAEDPRTRSFVAVTYGRPKFLFHDACYCSDDGRIHLVERTLVPPEDATSPAYCADLAAFSAHGRARIDARSTRLPVLDYSFCDVALPVDLLRVAPRGGRRHRRTRVEVTVAEDERREQLASAGGPRGEGKRQLIKARNKDGEEEAYEFNVDADTQKPRGAAMRDDSDGADKDQLLLLAQRLPSKFASDALRLCNNGLEQCPNLLPVLRSLVADACLTLAWVDLSCNALRAVPPGLDQLPLTTLYLHSNQLADWGEVRGLLSLKLLQALTLFGNPLATSNADYRNVALGILAMGVPGKAHALKTLDFVALSACDKHVATTFNKFHPDADVRPPRKYDWGASTSGAVSPRKAAGMPGSAGGSAGGPHAAGASGTPRAAAATTAAGSASTTKLPPAPLSGRRAY